MAYLYVATLLIFFTVATMLRKRHPKSQSPVPISVNYHLTRKCNYECGFCFHTAKTSYILTLEEAKRGLAILQQTGMKKLNFAGGEPNVVPEVRWGIGEVQQNRDRARIGVHRDKWKPVSCDSFDEATNVKIGRGTGSHLEKFKQLRLLCQEYGIKFKVNTVVNRYNFAEDMRTSIEAIAPFRWKCFQVLVVKGENDSGATLRDATRFVISDDEFQQFCNKHSNCSGFVAEPNNLMKDSYLILDEYMRFLDKGNDPSLSILEVGVEQALQSVYWDEESFRHRGGIYDWTKAPREASAKLLDW
ncbi:related to Radical S-adenosyl methionine domain-containing protein 2 [Rhynchosporium agropyri]|uniref:Related to Radical S-adenosyl methionine domain-containing protein 2 n=1 Tax=Rhynchosporium agropyri TaxID=914238 RepID=A0A1E1LDY2_9HELO|nr:related to Radical S-adenosyl methionine domain-containing protein 2 [Rhynchosporium agropyri]